MGLDMYLTGEKFLWTDHENPSNNRMEDGYRINTVIVELGYWRKHPNLHGFIVKTFANGEDNQDKIELSANNIKTIIEAIKNDALPHTSGFFFGASDGTEKDEDLRIFERALLWLGKVKADPLQLVADSGPFQVFEVRQLDPNEKDSRTVYYQASW